MPSPARSPARTQPRCAMSAWSRAACTRAGTTLGIRLTWDKRYITLAPNATLAGPRLPPVRSRQPSRPRRGDRHHACADPDRSSRASRSGGGIFRPAPPSPTARRSGRDVFIPIDWIIGGQERAGQGWRMLMSCLAAGRSISLPATSAAAAKSMLRTSTAYARIRKQFNLPIGFMEGIEEPLARMIESAYAIEAARAVTASMVSAGREAGRHLGAAQICLDRAHAPDASTTRSTSMAARGICDGPSNYLQGAYQMAPVGDHRRGRQHPDPHADHLRPRRAAQSPLSLHRDRGAARPGRRARHRAVRAHLRPSMSPSPSPTPPGRFWHNLTFGVFASAPPNAGDTARWWRRARARLALLRAGRRSDRGAARRRAEGEAEDHRPHGRCACRALSAVFRAEALRRRRPPARRTSSWSTIAPGTASTASTRRCSACLRNFPVRWAAWAMAPLVFPLGCAAASGDGPGRQGDRARGA